MDAYAAWLDRGVLGGAVYGRVLLRGVVRKIALDTFVWKCFYIYMDREIQKYKLPPYAFTSRSLRIGGSLLEVVWEKSN